MKEFKIGQIIKIYSLRYLKRIGITDLQGNIIPKDEELQKLYTYMLKGPMQDQCCDKKTVVMELSPSKNLIYKGWYISPWMCKLIKDVDKV